MKKLDIIAFIAIILATCIVFLISQISPVVNKIIEHNWPWLLK